MKGVPEDDEGLDIEFLRRGLEAAESKATSGSPTRKTGERYKKLYRHIIYCVPTFSNPSAKTMSLRRRQELIRLAREFDALVITDDVYDVLRWPAHKDEMSEQLGQVPPRLVDIDRTLNGGPKDEWGNAVSNGSFSKIIAPGRYATQAGGYFIWLLLPRKLFGRGAELAARGLEKYDLKFAHGGMMQVQGDSESAKRATEGYGNGIRLSWAWHTENEIVEGIERLSALVSEALNGL
ncbi:putative aminotransferase [Stemphylium lycopersici]|uniref:Aminotransferase n=1 Tax=Stemphylium lycopersici TaxID=183478 RepID=A0A364NDB6_STELY|nr:valine-pyruvate aminotransferase [Stemphylium lycopersici]RAR00957.1 putative aminotransferase [Stemphylium lycopersici]RAR15252.1 aminotransferase [Stemphylium lycopersici]